mmetsp:Transcript_27433/g.54877  ORF Transcript_27433/g.54877 Transcript_27433/m.54877 type:complete len:468 (-) Transcript_27433:156-1559(-)
MRLRPSRMKHSIPVNPLIRMPPKEVPLCLSQIRRQPLPPIRIKVIQTPTQRRRRHSIPHRHGHDSPPSSRPLVQLPGHDGIENEIGQILIPGQRILNLLKNLSSNDASSLPHAGAFREIDVPVHIVRAGFDDPEALGVGADFGTVECRAKIVEELAFVDGDFGGGDVGSLEDCRGFDSFVFASGDVACVEGGGHSGSRDASFGGFLDGPAACAFHSGFVQDVVDDVSLSGDLVILLCQDLGSDLDQITLQFRGIPVVKDLRHLLVRNLEHGLHNIVNFTNQLHISVFNSIVNHLDVISRPHRTQISGTGPVIDLRRALGNDRLDQIIRLLRPAGHETRSVPRPLLSSRNAHADEVDPLGFQLLGPAKSVVKPFVPTVDDDVPRFQILTQGGDGIVDGFPRHDEDDDFTRLGELLAKLFGGGGAGDGEVALFFGAVDGEFDFGGGAVADADFEAVGGHVEGEVLAHDC